MIHFGILLIIREHKFSSFFQEKKENQTASILISYRLITTFIGLEPSSV